MVFRDGFPHEKLNEVHKQNTVMELAGDGTRRKVAFLEVSVGPGQKVLWDML